MRTFLYDIDCKLGLELFQLSGLLCQLQYHHIDVQLVGFVHDIDMFMGMKVGMYKVCDDCADSV